MEEEKLFYKKRASGQQFSVKRGSLWIKGFNGRGKIFFAKFGD